MIFATVGTQLPFDRLLLALDTWAALHPDVRVLAQTGPGRARYPHMQCAPHLDQRGYAEAVDQARVIVAHAGMGTILTALETGKPLVLMPRRADLGEHRNDHQRDTAAEMAALSSVTIVDDGPALCLALNRLLAEAPARVDRTEAVASPPLIEAVRSFIWADTGRGARR